jgi:hypothetical protein
MIPLTSLLDISIGTELIRKSQMTELPVVVSFVNDNIVTVKLRSEDHLMNVKAMTIGMMELGAEGSPVQMVKNVAWRYDLFTAQEIDAFPGLESILLKP